MKRNVGQISNSKAKAFNFWLYEDVYFEKYKIIFEGSLIVPITMKPFMLFYIFMENSKNNDVVKIKYILNKVYLWRAEITRLTFLVED